MQNKQLIKLLELQINKFNNYLELRIEEKKKTLLNFKETDKEFSELTAVINELQKLLRLNNIFLK